VFLITGTNYTKIFFHIQLTIDSDISIAK